LPIYGKAEPDKTTEKKVKQISQVARALVKMYGQKRINKSEQHKKVLDRQIDAAETSINLALYELYGLDAGEVAKIEGGSYRYNRRGRQRRDYRCHTTQGREEYSRNKKNRHTKANTAGGKGTKRTAL
jgi:hypothetical protein